MLKDGNTVKVHYTGKLDDGTIFDSSVEREPLEFTIGTGQIISGFEGTVRGMQVGQVKTITIPAEEAYGPHNEDMVFVVERDKLPENLNPVVGERLEKRLENGNTAVLVVIDFSDTTITLDANHPLAGKTLTFEIELLEIR
ncbi:peptidylprolyl isomerase [Chloroflexota bacterium]